MHAPRPYGYFGPDLDSESMGAVDKMMRRITNLKAVSGVENVQMYRVLPDGRMARGYDMGGIFKVIVSDKPPVEPEDAGAEESWRVDTPMLFSGVIERNTFGGGKNVSMKITRTTQKRLGGYGSKAKEYNGVKTGENQSLERFNIPYGARFGEFVPKPGALEHSQYVQLRPSWYSGAMAEVVQIVGGYGRQKFSPAKKDPTETIRLVMPRNVEAKVAEELKKYDLLASNGRPPDDGEIKYDYKFNECHAVSFDGKNKPWLLRISAAGVYAMPLPLVPATTTKAFKKWMEEVGDDEILWAINRFGGLPTGEAFPAGKAAKIWENAGVVIKVCRAGDFYSNYSYSPTCGWSFNRRGTEAYNTCYDYVGGVAQGYTYCLSVGMGAVSYELPDWSSMYRTDSPDRAVTARYMTRVLALAEPSERSGLRFLMRRCEVREIAGKARATLGEANEGDLEFWRNKKMPPIASHSGSITKTASGPLHHAVVPTAQPKIHFPDPFERACAPFNFNPIGEGWGENPKCDTIMYAYFIGDTLKVVKYFKDLSNAKVKDDNNFTDCMIVGSWTSTFHRGDSYLHGHFYTTDFDDRTVIADSSTTTTIVGTDRGYDDSPPLFAFDYVYSMSGTLWRNRHYTTHTTSSTSEGRFVQTGVCIPYFCRSAALYGFRDFTGNAITSSSTGGGSVTDPTSYSFWTYHPIWHWTNPLPIEYMTGEPKPTKGKPVWVTKENSGGGGGCSEFADQGPWISGLPADYTWLIKPKEGENPISGGGMPMPLNTSSSTSVTKNVEKRSTKASVMDEPSTIRTGGEEGASKGYFSGHEGALYGDCIRLTAGEAIYASTSETASGYGGARYHWGYTSLADHRSAHHFIGVINQ